MDSLLRPRQLKKPKNGAQQNFGRGWFYLTALNENKSVRVCQLLPTFAYSRRITMGRIEHVDASFEKKSVCSRLRLVLNEMLGLSVTTTNKTIRIAGEPILQKMNTDCKSQFSRDEERIPSSDANQKIFTTFFAGGPHSTPFYKAPPLPRSGEPPDEHRHIRILPRQH